MFQIFYAYSALIANIVDSHGGTATEFLGDGVLCLFEIDGTIGNTLEAAMRAAKDIMSARREIINPAFMQFDLPLIDYGVGIDYGKTIVTRFGFKEDNDLKAFGKCAYAVSRLCKGVNEIKVSEKCKSAWPSAPNGGLTLMYDSDVDGKLAYRASY
jgi:class 3 adenylate cyclase